MKKFLMIILIACSLTSYGQDTSKLTIQQVYSDAKSGFRELVNNLEGPSKHVYTVYVRQYQIVGWMWLISGFLILTIGLFLVARNWKKADFDDSDGNRFATLAIIGVVVTVIGVIFTSAAIVNNIPQIFNPEYYAIEKIIQSLKQ
jgi:uncharacterized integral membrane protein